MKYKNLRELAAAFVTGELDRCDYKLIMDDKESFLVYRGPLPVGVEDGTPAAARWRDAKRDEMRTWYRGHGMVDIVDACNAAGVPSEWA